MKLQRITHYQQKIQFPHFDNVYAAYLSDFTESDLGKVDCAIPWQALVKSLKIHDKKRGPQSIFSPKGKLALMFLKHYASCSDKKLIEHLNGNIHYQFFCDIYIPPGYGLKNFKIVSEIRTELSQKLNIEKAQRILGDYWRPYCTKLNSVTCDATCYESNIRYPTDIKLLWESVSWSHIQLSSITRQGGRRMLRTKFKKWKLRYVQYSKMRQKRKKKSIPLKRALLRLLHKINEELRRVEHMEAYSLPPKYWSRRKTIEEICEQQSQLFYHGVKPHQRIVSIDKPYIRPIVRGKEKKKVEFGAKVHKLQVDGISYIEHLDFEAFNEGIRLKETIYKTQLLTHTKVRVLGADGIYANNANRNYVTQQKISTDFKRKGKATKHETHRSQLCQMITKERVSRLEGSFGTDKEYFLLNRIKARTQLNERLWIFFGIHTSNALKIGRRMSNVFAKVA